MSISTKSPIVPSLPDLFLSLKQDIFKNLNCVKIGKIQSYDSTNKVAQIQILFKRKTSSGDIASYPVLVSCPIYIMQGGGWTIEMPVAAGDECILLFSDSNIDNWYLTGSEALPADMRSHAIADGIAIVGLKSKPHTLTNIISIDATGNVTIALPSGKKFSVTGDTEIDMMGTLALALLSDVQNLVTTFNSHSHLAGTLTAPAGGGAVTGTSGAPTASAGNPTGTTKLKGS
jgi:Phage protein Gp138 N-terminal domain